MGAAGAVVAIGLTAFVVLRDMVAFDRPAPPPRPVEPVAAPVVAPPVVVAPEPEPEYGSLLAGLTETEADDRPVSRRIGSALLLVAVVAAASTAIGGLIYRGLTR
ncbi:MAG: hypothetical protein QOE45_1499 [Frankiaceae bacterium]|jgi:hypothetical protein|nr:hypothetical protein [Frankiaceae bacterium]